MESDVQREVVSYSVELPSRGILYEGKLPGGVIEMTPMTTSDEKMLAGAKGDRAALVDTLLKRCLVTKSVPFEDYLIGDKLFMLLFLRGISYGFGYEFSIRCRTCGNSFKHRINIPNDLRVRVLTEDDFEPFEAKLPVSGKTVALRLLRNRDEDEVHRYVKREVSRSSSDGDPSYMIRLSKHIVSVDGRTLSPVESLSFVEGLAAKDSLVIRNTVDSHDCGVDLEVQCECPICRDMFEQTMPFTQEFFRPTRLLESGGGV
jgi:hypothetical protein